VDITIIENQMLEAIDQFASKLPAERAQSMRELVMAGESGVAFENLCENLFDYETFPEKAMWERLKTIGLAMKINPEYWERLQAGNS
jgi:hypothetical protein